MIRHAAFSNTLAVVAGLLSFAFCAALTAQEDGDKAAQDLMKAFEAMSLELEKFQSGNTDPLPEIVMIDAPGEYPPGRYIGRCEAKRKPESLAIGDRYEVRYVQSAFFRKEQDGGWNGVGASSPKSGVSEHVCAATEDNRNGAHFLGGSAQGEIRGPGQYELRVTGYVERYEVRKCVTVGGGLCPQRISREEIDYEIPFEIVP
jgi:hypothetical protein